MHGADPPGGQREPPTKHKELAIKTAIVLFTRDLRVRDNPALAAACEQAGLVVPLFAVDGRLMSTAPNHIHMPWRLPPPLRRQFPYPEPITG